MRWAATCGQSCFTAEKWRQAYIKPAPDRSDARKRVAVGEKAQAFLTAAMQATAGTAHSRFRNPFAL
ncbi:MAG: hypothetical protein ACTTJ1_06855 [Treponema sp.]